MNIQIDLSLEELDKLMDSIVDNGELSALWNKLLTKRSEFIPSRQKSPASNGLSPQEKMESSAQYGLELMDRAINAGESREIIRLEEALNCYTWKYMCPALQTRWKDTQERLNNL